MEKPTTDYQSYFEKQKNVDALEFELNSVQRPEYLRGKGPWKARSVSAKALTLRTPNFRLDCSFADLDIKVVKTKELTQEQLRDICDYVRVLQNSVLVHVRALVVSSDTRLDEKDDKSPSRIIAQNVEIFQLIRQAEILLQSSGPVASVTLEGDGYHHIALKLAPDGSLWLGSKMNIGHVDSPRIYALLPDIRRVLVDRLSNAVQELESAKLDKSELYQKCRLTLRACRAAPAYGKG